LTGGRRTRRAGSFSMPGVASRRPVSCFRCRRRRLAPLDVHGAVAHLSCRTRSGRGAAASRSPGEAESERAHLVVRYRGTCRASAPSAGREGLGRGTAVVHVHVHVQPHAHAHMHTCTCATCTCAHAHMHMHMPIHVHVHGHGMLCVCVFDTPRARLCRPADNKTLARAQVRRERLANGPVVAARELVERLEGVGPPAASHRHRIGVAQLACAREAV